jgi:Protein of unknown function (DUF3306)
MSNDEGFLSRWARRKAQVRGGSAAAGGPHADALPQGANNDQLAPAALPESTPATAQDPERKQSAATPTEAAPPLPTMDDVARLSRSSDFSRFVAPGVDEGVKRAAMRKLFSDPHFNVMDGLDTYIDDYNVSTPLSESDLRKMAQSEFLRLFEQDDSPDPKEAMANPDGAAPAPVSQSPVAGPSEAATPTSPAVPPDENTDLRLQPDDAAGRAGAEPRTRPERG